MKKLALTISIVLGLSMTTFAGGDGLFNRANNANNGVSGYSYFSNSRMDGDMPDTPILPNHNLDGNQSATAPVGSGIVLLAALGGAYLVGKKRREE